MKWIPIVALVVSGINLLWNIVPQVRLHRIRGSEKRSLCIQARDSLEHRIMQHSAELSCLETVESVPAPIADNLDRAKGAKNLYEGFLAAPKKLLENFDSIQKPSIEDFILFEGRFKSKECQIASMFESVSNTISPLLKHAKPVETKMSWEEIGKRMKEISEGLHSGEGWICLKGTKPSLESFSKDLKRRTQSDSIEVDEKDDKHAHVRCIENRKTLAEPKLRALASKHRVELIWTTHGG